MIEAETHGVHWSQLDLRAFAAYGVTTTMLLETTLWPLENIKTRLQARTGDVRFNSPIDVIRKVYKQHGVRGFYRGLLPGVSGALPAEAAYYVGYEFAKSRLSRLGVNKDLAPALAGAAAEASSCVISVPFDIVSQRLQIQDNYQSSVVRYRGALDGAVAIVRSEGFFGLWRGYFATLSAFVPQSALWWSVYEKTKGHLNNKDLRSLWGGTPFKRKMINTKDDTTGVTFTEDPVCHVLAAVHASLHAVTLTYPLDVAKMRIQTQEYGGPGVVVQQGNKPAVPTMNPLAILGGMLKEEGLRSWYRGLLPRICISIPAGILTMTLYEQVKVASTEDWDEVRSER